jgi:hypothetical protein
MLATFLVGIGLGFMSTPYLLAVQNAVPQSQRGVATSSVQFFRTIGGAIAVAALGAVINAHLAAHMSSGVNVNAALNPEARMLMPPEVLHSFVIALDRGLTTVYLVVAGMAAIGIFVALIFPKGSVEQHAHEEVRTVNPSAVG